MTNEEAKKALKNRTPVVFNNTEYLYISAIIYRYRKDTLNISVELMDKSKKSVTIAQVKEVTAIND